MKKKNIAEEYFISAEKYNELIEKFNSLVDRYNGQTNFLKQKCKENRNLVKENEWHYMKDGIMPEENQWVLVYDGSYTVCNYHSNAPIKWLDNYENEVYESTIIAWRKIVTPNEVEND